MAAKFQDSPAKQGPFAGLKRGDKVLRRDGQTATFDGYDPVWERGPGFDNQGMEPMPYAVTHPGRSGPVQLHHTESGRWTDKGDKQDCDVTAADNPQAAHV
jgi:hypothetical protein